MRTLGRIFLQVLKLLIIFSTTSSRAGATTASNSGSSDRENAFVQELVQGTCREDYDCDNGAECHQSECVCLPKTSGTRCDQIDCGKIDPACEESGGQCQYNVIEQEPFCECPEMKFLNVTSGSCEENCQMDYDCENGANCFRSECVCLPKTSGAKCENIDCSNINPACEDSGGLCQYNVLEEEPFCECPEMHFLNFSSGKCEENCENDYDCENGAKCDRFECVCLPNTSGRKCENIDCGKINPACEESGGHCKFDVLQFRSVCECPEGKFLNISSGKCEENCEKDYDCENGAKCDRSECVCLPNTSGTRCENIDCNTINPACEDSGGQCQFDVIQYRPVCECPETKFFNASSGKCEENCEKDYDCENGVKCVRSECVCLPKTFGTRCENIDCNTINPACEDSGGQCQFDAFQYKPVCECPKTKFFNASSGKCEENCENDYDCENGAKCIRSKCGCLPKTSGTRCENIDCGKINPLCEESSGRCQYNVIQQKPFCECPKMKFLNASSGKCEENCKKDYDCENGAKCVRSECVCLPNTFGTRCENIDCGNINPACGDSGGQCQFDALQYKPVCGCPERKFLNDSSGRCEVCDCGEHGKCKFSNGVKSCVCDSGFIETGGECQDPCSKNPCKNGATCIVDKASYRCICRKPYTGNNCDADPCSTNPCQNDGVCIVHEEAFKCFCKSPFSGNRCENDPCTPNPCQNGGTCFAMGGAFRCSCVTPFSGDTCETDTGKMKIVVWILLAVVAASILTTGMVIYRNRKYRQRMNEKSLITCPLGHLGNDPYGE